MLPFLAKARDDQGVTSLIAVRNNSNCNNLELKLEVRNRTGTVVSYVTDFWLSAGHIKLIDLANVGSVNPGFVGAGKVEVTDVHQLCDTDGDGHKDMTPTMPSVVVVNEGANPGDVTSVYEGIPFDYAGSSCLVTVSGQVIDEFTLKPVEDVSIKVNTVEKDKTDFTGYYEFQVPSSTWGTAFTLDVVQTGYYAWSKDYTLYCDDVVINPELDPVCKTVTVTGTVEDKETGLPIPGADVSAGNRRGAGTSAATDGEGKYTISDVPFDPDSVTIVSVSKAGYNPAADSVYIPACGGEAQISFQLHQTPKSRILLYYGNGGEAPAPESGLNDTPHEYYNAEDMFEYLGYLVDYTAGWPTDPDLEEYKVIFLLGPGNDSAPQDPASDDFTPGQIAQLDLFLRNGGRLVVMSDVTYTYAAWSTAPISVENNLVNALNDLDVEFTDADNDGWSDGQVETALADDLNTPDQLLGDELDGAPAEQDVHTLDFNAAISITVGGTANPGYIAAMEDPHPDDGAVICAADTMPGITRLSGPAFAGDVVLIGDLNWMDDFSWMGTITYSPFYVWPDWPADNENLLLNIITF
jgi:hypothetical protein